MWSRRTGCSIREKWKIYFRSTQVTPRQVLLRLSSILDHEKKIINSVLYAQLYFYKISWFFFKERTEGTNIPFTRERQYTKFHLCNRYNATRNESIRRAEWKQVEFRTDCRPDGLFRRREASTSRHTTAAATAKRYKRSRRPVVVASRRSFCRCERYLNHFKMMLSVQGGLVALGCRSLTLFHNLRDGLRRRARVIARRHRKAFVNLSGRFISISREIIDFQEQSISLFLSLFLSISSWYAEMHFNFSMESSDCRICHWNLRIAEDLTEGIKIFFPYIEHRSSVTDLKGLIFIFMADWVLINTSEVQ